MFKGILERGILLLMGKKEQKQKQKNPERWRGRTQGHKSKKQPNHARNLGYC